MKQERKQALSQRLASLNPEQRAALERKLRERGIKVSQLPIPPRTEPRDSFPLSFAQERLWFLQQLEPGSYAYHLRGAHRLQGPLDAAALRRSFAEIERRHESLRTRFQATGGEPLQVVFAPRGLALPIVDLSRLPAARAAAENRHQVEGQALRSFDLERDRLLRCLLVRLAPEDHTLVLTLHHIIADGWSQGVLLQEVQALYASALASQPSPLPELPIQYGDFALHQRRRLAAELLEEQLGYWREQLAGAPPVLELATDRPRPPVQTYRGGGLPVYLRPSWTAALRALARSEETTLFTTLLAAFELLMSRYSGQRDLTVGTPVVGRNQEETEELIGLFASTLVLRADLRGQPTFRELLRRARRTLLRAQSHQDLPFEKLVAELSPERSLSYSPLFQVMFAMQPKPTEVSAATQGAGLSVAPQEGGSAAAIFDLNLELGEGAEDVSGVLFYNADLFDTTTARRMMGHFGAIFEAVAADPDRPVAEIALLSPGQRQMLQVEWNDTALALPPRCLHALVEEQAERTPEAAAVVGRDEQLTYRELEQGANRLARRLRAAGVGRGARVAVSMPRGPRMVVALLATLKAGAAYVPVDPAYPRQRRDFMLADSGAALMLTAEAADAAQVPVLDLEAGWPEIAGESAERPRGGAGPDDLSHVIYTSGSTGRPKGVAIRHRSSAAMVEWARQAFSAEQTAVTLASTSISFDLSVYEIFLPLSRGGRVIVADNALELAQLPAASEVTLINTVPSAMRELLRMAAVPASVGTVNLAGEALPRALVEAIYQQTSARRVYNLYGPSEDTTYSTWALIAPGEATAPAIGRPVGGGRAYLLDRDLRPVPPGVVGEIFLAGSGLAIGYLDRPALTAERFVPDPHSDGLSGPGGRLYRTGDLGRALPGGELAYLGRRDHQVKVRGFRIELGEIEAALVRHEAVREVVVVVREDVPGDQRLVAYVAAEGEPAPGLAGELRQHLATRLPDPMLPSVFMLLEALPLTPNGKVDRAALPVPEGERPELASAYVQPQSEVEQAVAAVWKELLGVDRVGTRDNFFDLGGHSLLLPQVHARLLEVLGEGPSLIDLFRFPTIAALAEHLHAGRGSEPEVERGRQRGQLRKGEATRATGLAVIGMAGRYAQARDVAELWRNLAGGVEAVRFLTDDELRAVGVSDAELEHPDYVKACSVLEDVELFDAALFGMPPREAEMTDPQQRIFLECAWEALEHAACDPRSYGGAIGVYAGVGVNGYWGNVMTNPQAASLGFLPMVIANDKDFLPTRVSYKLDLKGPSVNVQTACSTSLVATHVACQALLAGECDVALAGGVSIGTHHPVGYFFQEDGIVSSDGHCRAFDARAEGTVPGNGAGIVVLKRLAEALADGDVIHAVVKGSAINNDGSLKVGFTAPSVAGQAQVIAEALSVAEVEPETVGYVEAHGTATALGDPIEVTALKEVFGSAPPGDGQQRCALGSIKTNLGHTDAAAGVAGLLKAVLALEHRQIPPSLHFEEGNSEIDFERSPFYVATELEEWQRPDGVPRRAGVSSFGLGGTNAHVVLEEAPERPASGPSRARQLLLLSAASEASLEGAVDRLAQHLESHPDEPLADVAHTLQSGRRRLSQRRFVVCGESAEAAEILASRNPQRLLGGASEAEERPVVFLLPGVGDHYPHMAAELYRDEPAFRATLDRCAELLAPHLGTDLREVLFPPADAPAEEAAAEGLDLKQMLGRGAARRSPAAERLDRTELAQPAVFAVEVALASLWEEWGVTPEALAGYSLGEYTAACLAGVMRLEDALRLVAVRAKLIEELPGGAMLAVPLAEEDLLPRLAGEVALAATNTAGVCVVSGPEEAVAALEAKLADDDLVSQRLATSHAFHSPMMQPIAERFAAEVARVELSAPQIPYISNVTGTWVTAAEATDPQHWVRHLCGTVRFAEGLAELLQAPDRILLEVGPGQALSTAARQHPAAAPSHVTVTSLRDARQRQPDGAFLLGALGRLWSAGAKVSWEGFSRHEQRRRLVLPTYAFDRRRFWLEASAAGLAAAPQQLQERARKPDLADWFYAPAWGPSDLPPAPPEGVGRCLVLTAGAGDSLGGSVVERLRQRGDEVVEVRPGERFESCGDGVYTLDPGDRSGYDALLRELQDSGGLPAAVLHLWGVGGAGGARPSPEESDRLLERGFFSLLFLVQSFTDLGHFEPLRLLVVTSGVHAVTGSEALVPEKAAALGPARVLPQEYGHVQCRNIDVMVPESPAAGGELAERLLEELAAETVELAVAYRRQQRWVQHFMPVRLADKPRRLPRVRRGACILITGGLGGIGLSLARGLAESAGARLVLTSRTGLPQRQEWEVLSQGDDEDAERIRQVLELEALGAEVMVAAADATDSAAVAAAVAAARHRFGAVHGVIHAAGIAGQGMAQLKTRQVAEQILAPKVRGARVLEAALGDTELDFFVVLSSTASVLGGLGQVDYCGANAALDAFAHGRAAAGGTALALNYGVWQDVGLAMKVEVTAQYEQEHRENLELGMSPAEGVRAFYRALDRDMPQLVVSPPDFEIEQRGSLQLHSSQVLAGMAERQEGGSHPRPELATPYVAPRDEQEAALAGIWQDLLGIERVGIHDSFFELGGDSLLATMMLSRLRSALKAQISLQRLFEAPTVAGLVAAADADGEAGDDELGRMEDLLARIEEMSESEAEDSVFGESEVEDER